jgi:hypothetical protein
MSARPAVSLARERLDLELLAFEAFPSRAGILSATSWKSTGARRALLVIGSR